MGEITDHMIETLIEKWQHTLDWLSNYDSEETGNRHRNGPKNRY